MSRLFKVVLAVVAVSLSTLAWSEPGKIAVVDVQGAILATDLAQKRMAEVRDEKDYKADKVEFDRLKSEFEVLLKKFQKDSAVMSAEQQTAARNKLATKQADLEHVAGKLQQTEQVAGQALLQEMSPKVQEVLREIISEDEIGLLLRSEAVINADAGYSITTKVTDKLNQITTK
ncbi:MAG: OmpH family outer membrane protein [Halioglobus sp.]|nr:OmpH family outer membrane protein [Halioglobus sp.]